MVDQKKPWEAKVFATKIGQYLRSDRKDMVFSSFILSVLFSIFFLMLVGMLLIIYYTSNGGSEKETSRDGFYLPSKVVVQKEEPKEEPKEETPEAVEEEKVVETQDQVIRNGATTTVLAGEGAGAIAARSGISLDQLYALNPEKMVGPGGTWWANPGDVVYIN
ncbi:SAG1386/EF1546 family surface-associated protein [Streptococcus fryi]